MKRYLNIGIVMALVILLSVSVALSEEGNGETSVQEDEESSSSLPDSPEGWQDYVKENPEEAKEYFSDPNNVQASPDGYTELLNEYPEEAGNHPDVFENAAAADNTLLQNTEATQSYFQANNIPMTMEGGIESYDGTTFTTAGGDTFTNQGLQNLANQGYTFEVNADGNLVIRGEPPAEGEPPVDMTFTGDAPGNINENGEITEGEIDMDGDGQADVRVDNGPVTPTGADLHLGPDAMVTADGDGDGDFDTEITSDNGLDFSMGGECATGNCVDISDGTLSVSNDGQPPSNVDVTYDAYDENGDGEIDPTEGPYNHLNVNLDEEGAQITLTENDFTEDGSSLGTTTLELTTDSKDCIGNLMLPSIGNATVSIGGDLTAVYNYDADSEEGTWQGCAPGTSSTTGQATSFFSFVGKAWDWMTGRAASESPSPCTKIGTLKGSENEVFGSWGDTHIIMDGEDIEIDYISSEVVYKKDETGAVREFLAVQDNEGNQYLLRSNGCPSDSNCNPASLYELEDSGRLKQLSANVDIDRVIGDIESTGEIDSESPVYDLLKDGGQEHFAGRLERADSPTDLRDEDVEIRINGEWVKARANEAGIIIYGRREINPYTELEDEDVRQLPSEWDNEDNAQPAGPMYGGTVFTRIEEKECKSCMDDCDALTGGPQRNQCKANCAPQCT